MANKPGSKKSCGKKKSSSDKENGDSSTRSTRSSVHNKTPPVMESSRINGDQPNDWNDEIDADGFVHNCPVCRKAVLAEELAEHLSTHVPKYSCHMCTFSSTTAEEFSTHFSMTHQIDQHLKPGMVGIKHHPIRLLMESNNNSITAQKFNAMKKKEKLKEVEIPGNGFCFVSSLLVALAEQGLYKSYENLVREIMNEVEFHSKAYRWTDGSNESVVVEEENVLKACEDFLQKGEYTSDYADICVGSAANALGINMNIFFKNAENKYVLYTHDCLRYASKVNIFLIYYKKNPKSLDAHYNCYVNTDYYNKNKAAIRSRIICGEAPSKLEQIHSDMLYAQKLSREEAMSQETSTRRSTSRSCKEKRYDLQYEFCRRV